jgi:hypothetical protein
LQLHVGCNVRFLLKRSDASDEVAIRRNQSQEKWSSEQFKRYIISLPDLVDISNPPNRDAIIELLQTRCQAAGNSSAVLGRGWLSKGYYPFIRESMEEDLVIDDVGHQHGQQLGQSIDTTSEGCIRRGASWRPASLASGVYPMPDYRVDHIENAQLVGGGSLLEVGVDFLDENGFILRCRVSISSTSSQPS